MAQPELFHAVCCGDVVSVSKHVQRASINELNDAGLAVVHGMAAVCPKEVINAVAILLGLNAADFNLPAEDGTGSPPVFFACRSLTPGSALACLKGLNANINVKNNRNQTPFHYLLSEDSKCNDLEELRHAMELLLQSEVSLKDKCSEGISGEDLLELLPPPKRETAQLVIKAIEESRKIKEESKPEESKENIEIKEDAKDVNIEDDSCQTTESPSSMAIEEIETASENSSGSFLDPSQPLIDVQNQDALLRRLLIRQNLQEFVLSQLALSQRLNRGFGGTQPSQPSTGASPQPASQPTLVQRSYDNRPSVYNRRISSEQAQLPDGRLCTRVPARRWSKRDSDWNNFQYTCDFCPMFGDVRKYRRKAELVRHQALHFPEQARKFKCALCNYSATRNEYLKSHMSNRHGIVQPKDSKRSKHSSTPSLPSLENGLSFPTMLQIPTADSPGCSSSNDLSMSNSVRSEETMHEHGTNSSQSISDDINSQRTISSNHSPSWTEPEPLKIEIMEN
ncbi:Oidioi.mRNA.OKI2018_I69.XSR.g15205.t1.cds [Oikopleura dioica]|uniref:Oidioi.mRNA.OKI2018_I69.XSR.g15205.t1.cds n=1 Tax=Oikopleura dioica TaxID=34765 RepID=A0ABN7SJH3_OIKDI|nr:Oidioi.mRNA.OKI2018_I69.XSR.g15205.t1.cds [Oikopleura dioica]